MQNRYFIVRHGESTANVRGVIVSDPVQGAHPDNGLSPKGMQQSREV
jgi:broad specificity phosphatase PhoE